MKEAADFLIYESASRGNILPLTSKCNVRCLFCSHWQNPSDIQIYRIGHRTVEQVKDTLQFIDPGSRIIIGESVTKIIEGEPFVNPYIKEILSLIRRTFPHTIMQITTNGSLVDMKTSQFLAALGGVEINLSLNSSSCSHRTKLMSDHRAGIAVNSAACLRTAGVPFHGSLVAMPHITGWADIRNTVLYLTEAGALTVRVFLPGFTRLAPEKLAFDSGLWQELTTFVAALVEETEVPLMVEPPLIRDLSPVVRGVIKGTPAYTAGLQKHDIIRSVNGERCISRVDAFQKASRGTATELIVEREDRLFEIVFDKRSGQKTGMVMDYDIDPGLIKEITQRAAKYNKVVILCSEFGEPVLRMALSVVNGEQDLELLIVKSRYFGGSIGAAGLLVVTDFLAALSEHGLTGENQALFLPGVAFDREGRDLTGCSYLKIEEVTGKKVEII